MNFSIHQASHIGHRKYNQDRVAYAYSNESLLLVLADGMGGHLHGEKAASIAIETFVETFGQHAQPLIENPNAFIQSTMRYAHERIMKIPHDKDMGGIPGTTCVAVLIQDGKMYWGHAGDSRVYLLRDGTVLTKTNDHSMVHQLVKRGRITPEQARVHPQRNQITNCLGGMDDLFFAELGKPIALQSEDVILLGSDGLWGPFADNELVESFIVSSVKEVLESLVQHALQREAGKSDNITGIAVRWDKGDTYQTNDHVYNILEVS